MDAESPLVVDLPVDSPARPDRLEWAQLGTRARAVWLLGPLTVVGGLAWAILQPYRITLLHPRGQGFWFLFVQPPLWVIAAGIAFALLVARALVADIEATEDERP
jgi:hypothetical protein